MSRGYTAASRNVTSKPGDLYNAAKSGLKMYPGKATAGGRGAQGPLGRPFLKNKKTKPKKKGGLRSAEAVVKSEQNASHQFYKRKKGMKCKKKHKHSKGCK